MLIGIAKLLALSLTANCLDSPLAWSPDGRWLAYTVHQSPSGTGPAAGWLFSPGTPAAARNRGLAPGAAPAAPVGNRFRIWAVDRAGSNPVLIDESPWPLSAPGWSLDGQRLAYLRFVPGEATNPPDLARGRCELVVQDALDRKRVVLTLAGTDLGPEEQQRFCTLQPCWSPDGEAVLFRRPGGEAAVLVVHPERGRIRTTLLGAVAAAWSPEGRRLAVVTPSQGSAPEAVLQVLGPDFAVIRRIKGFDQLHGRPAWSGDGLSLLVVGRRLLPQVRGRGPELIRVQVDTGLVIPILALTAPINAGRPQESALSLGLGERPGPSPRFFLDFDRNLDACVFAAHFPGRDPVIGHCAVRIPQVHKRFPAIDVGLGVGAVAMHPDGQLIAARVEGLDHSGPAFLCQLDTEQVLPLTPDPAGRRAWVSTLAAACLELLESSLPQATVDGRPLQRPGLLPIAGELSDQSSTPARLRRLGKIGRALVRHEPEPSAAVPAGGPDSGVVEYRLLFDYLAGEFAAAEADLVEREAAPAGPELRLRLLAARAQVLHAQGQAERARAVVDYILEVQRRAVSTAEETPLGLSRERIDDPLRAWLLYLAARIARLPESPPSAPSEQEDEEAEEIDLRIPAELLRPNRPERNAQLREALPLLPLGPGERLREAAPRDALPDPFEAARLRRAFPPLPPRPFQPNNPDLPRFPRPGPGANPTRR
jgi:hypothetical protein